MAFLLPIIIAEFEMIQWLPSHLPGEQGGIPTKGKVSTHLCLLPIVREVVQTEGAVGRVVLHLQRWDICVALALVLVLGSRGHCLSKAASGQAVAVCSCVSLSACVCVHVCGMCMSQPMHVSSCTHVCLCLHVCVHVTCVRTCALGR